MDFSPNPLISPSKAAQAASLSRAWSEVTAFLGPLFHPNPIPSFERNEATLSAFLTLASHLTSQTEQNALLASTRAQALKELRETEREEDPTSSILTSIKESLTAAGREALEKLASLSVALGSVSTNPERMASQLANLTRSECEVEQQLQRVEILHQQLKSEHALALDLLSKLRSSTNTTSTSATDDFHSHHRNTNTSTANLAQKTSDWNRGTKQIGLKMNEYKSRTKALESTLTASKKPDFGLPEIKTEERELRDLEKRVRGLEGRVRGFDGLPPDREMALMEVERMRRELEGLVRRRDGLFEGLVEGCGGEGGK